MKLGLMLMLHVVDTLISCDELAKFGEDEIITPNSGSNACIRHRSKNPFFLSGDELH
jgi:hypothetical protein